MNPSDPRTRRTGASAPPPVPPGLGPTARPQVADDRAPPSAPPPPVSGPSRTVTPVSVEPTAFPDRPAPAPPPADQPLGRNLAPILVGVALAGWGTVCAALWWYAE